MIHEPLNPRSLVVGASGMVGTQMLAALGSAALATSRSPRPGWITLDLAELAHQAEAAALFDVHPLRAIYCVGGMTNVDGCESAPDRAWRINSRGPGIFAAYARHRALPFVYFSTEYVFDGSRGQPGPYPETAPTNPLSVYGKTKLEGERLVLSAHPDALILRTTVVYGPDPGGKNYVYSLLRNLLSGIEMKVPEDQISTPTYNRDLARTTVGLVHAGASGVFHVCGPERLGRLEFAHIVARRFNLDASLLKGISTSDLRQTAPRPLDAGLATEKLMQSYPSLRVRTVAQSLDECADEIHADVVR